MAEETTVGGAHPLTNSFTALLTSFFSPFALSLFSHPLLPDTRLVSFSLSFRYLSVFPLYCFFIWSVHPARGSFHPLPRLANALPVHGNAAAFDIMILIIPFSVWSLSRL